MRGQSTRETGRGSFSAQRSAQTRLVDPPEVVLATVDEGHRDLLAEAVLEVGVGVDVDLVERLAQVLADGRITARASSQRWQPGRE